MIRHIAENRKEELLALAQSDPLGIRLAVNALAYGLTSPFFDVWLQEAGGEVTGAVGRLDGAGTLLAADGFDEEEMASFLQAVGMERLLCGERAAARLPFLRVQSALLLTQPMPAPGRETGLFFDYAPSPRLLYPLLQAGSGESIALPPFDGWYVDVSHKQRRGLIRAVAAYKGEELVGCAMTAGETEGRALVSGVAVTPRRRGRGFGRAVTAALTGELHRAGKEVFLLRAKGENEAFYRSLGFLPCGEYAFLRPGGKEHG